MNHFYHPVTPSYVFLLCQFAAANYYVINFFISVFTLSTVAILLCIFNFHFNIIGPGQFFWLLLFYKVVFHWSLPDSKSRQVSRTLLSTLAGLNNAVLLIVSTISLISKSPSHYFWRLFQVYHFQLVLLSLSCSTAFLVFWQSLLL